MQTYPIKYVLVGDSGVGKTQLSRQFMNKTFVKDAQSTISMEFSTRAIPFEKCIIKAQVWDTAGQERYESMTKAYFRDALGAVLVYDICSRDSFLHLQNIWHSQVQMFGHKNMKLILVGNKVDKVVHKGGTDPSPEGEGEGDKSESEGEGEGDLRQVSTQEGIEFARQHNIDFIETSALSGNGVEVMFRRVCLSVASELPGVKIHLDITGLPVGWIANNIPAPLPSEDSPTNRALSTLVRRASLPIKALNISMVNSKLHGSNEDRESGDTSRAVSECLETFHVRYINYWTGEEQDQEPTQAAETGLLFTATPPSSSGVIRDEVYRRKLKRESSTFTDRTGPTERSSSVTLKDADLYDHGEMEISGRASRDLDNRKRGAGKGKLSRCLGSSCTIL